MSKKEVRRSCFIKHIVKSYTLILILFIASLASNGQDILDQMPMVTPPSPKAETFTVYGDIPVDYSTGTPDITIPIYTIKVGDFILPIELKYNIRSVKPPFDESNIAFGWTLQYGGLISRTGYGLADVMYEMKIDEVRNDEQDCDREVPDYLIRASHENENRYDTQYDIFNFQSPGGVGEFIVVPNTDGTYSGHVLDPSLGAFVTPTIGPYTGTNPSGFIEDEIVNFKIIDDRGFVYEYGNREREIVENTRTQNMEGYSAWLLQKIHGPERSNILSYTYEDQAFTQNRGGLAGGWMVTDALMFSALPAGGLGPITYDRGTIPFAMNYYQKTLKRIDFTGGSIECTLKDSNKTIEKLTIKDSDGNVKRIVAFNTSPFPGNFKLRKLNGVVFKDAVANQIKEYTMDYFENYVPHKNLFRVDYWGYFNGNSSGDADGRMTPNHDYQCRNGNGMKIPCHIPDGESRTASLNWSKAFVLKKLTYPTGGSSEFEYELNRFNDQIKGTTSGGGLRIKKIINRDDITGDNTIEYTYSGGSSRHSVYNTTNYISSVSYAANFYDYTYPVPGSPKLTAVSRNVYLSDHILPFLDISVRYDKVDVIQKAGTSTINGKTTYEYSYPSNHFISGDYREGLHPPPGASSGYFDNVHLDVSHIESYLGAGTSAQLDNIIYYRRDNNTQSYSIVRKVEYKYQTNHYSFNTFQDLGIVQLFSGYETNAKVFLSDMTGSQVWDAWVWSNGSAGINCQPVWRTYDRWIRQGVRRKTSETTTDYFNGLPSLKTKIDYAFDKGLDKNVSKVTTTYPTGELEESIFFYPYDFTYAPFSEMQLPSINITSPVVFAIAKRDGIVTSRTDRPFEKLGTRVFRPKEVRRSLGPEINYETEFELQHDSQYGNLKQTISRDKIYTAYKWGYDDLYPVIIGHNMSYGTLSPRLNNALSKTGTGYADLESLLDAVGAMSSQVAKNLWSEFNTELRNQLTTSVLWSATTYTYDPLFGVTSATDPNGFATYYKYDEAGRLYQIIDHDGNVISQHDYNYKN